MIKSLKTTGIVPVLAADTVIYTVDTDERIGITALSCYNESSETVTVNFYLSPDLTSVSGDEVQTIVIEPQQEMDISYLIGHGINTGDSIIAVGDLTGVNSQLTYTLFTGEDV